MKNQMDRTLTILADGEPVTGYARARLLGTERLGLYPSLFMLHLWNVAEEDYLALSRSREVTVLHDDVVLVSGSVSDAFRSRGKSGTEAHVAIAPGLKLWEADCAGTEALGSTRVFVRGSGCDGVGNGSTTVGGIRDRDSAAFFSGRGSGDHPRPGVLWQGGGVH